MNSEGEKRKCRQNAEDKWQRLTTRTRKIRDGWKQTRVGGGGETKKLLGK